MDVKFQTRVSRVPVLLDARDLSGERWCLTSVGWGPRVFIPEFIPRCPGVMSEFGIGIKLVTVGFIMLGLDIFVSSTGDFSIGMKK